MASKLYSAPQRHGHLNMINFILMFVLSEQEQSMRKEVTEVATSVRNKLSQSGFLFGSASVGSLSFQSVAASPLTDSLTTPDKSPGLKGARAQLFAASTTKDDSDGDAADGDHPDEPCFEPFIPLPVKIDVKTGEEDEQVMFSHRAKFYRFVAEEKQWKERGIGDIKLLRNVTSGKMRVLMRRDQVLKLCANHQITTDTSLQPNAGSDRSWVWSTHADFSEGECKAERLAVRFKNEDIARKFKEKFEECQEMLKNQASLKPPLQKETVNTEGVKEDLFAKFKAEEGSWECDTCMVRNGSDKLVCAACASSKPGIKDSQEKKSEGKPIFGSGSTSSGTGFIFGSGASSSGTGFSFGSGATRYGKGFVFGSTGTNEGSAKPFEECQEMLKNQASLKPPLQKENVNAEGVKEDLFAKFKAEEGSWECDTCMVRNGSDKLVCAACASSKPGIKDSQEKKSEGKPIFGSGSTSSGTGFIFGSGASSSGTGFSFGSGATRYGKGFVFGSTGTNEGSAKPFEECQEMLKNQASLKPPLQKENVNAEGVKEDLFAKFKAEEGSWECDTCMVRNGSDKLVCAACTTPKPGAQTSQMPANGGTPSFSFGTAGAPSNSGFSFGSPASSVDAGSGFASASSQGFSFGSNSSSSGTGFVFGQQKADEKSSKPVFAFGLGSIGPCSFGSTQKEENTGVRADDVG